METAYGEQLIDRSFRPTSLTQAGAHLHRHAVKILDALSDMETELGHQGPRPISNLRVGFQASIATTVTPGLVSLAKNNYGVQDMTLHAGEMRFVEGLFGLAA